MEHRLVQPASRDQIVAIIRQRAERAANREMWGVPAVGNFGQGWIDRDIRAQWGAQVHHADIWGDLGRPPVYRQAALPPDEELKPRIERLQQINSNFKYKADKSGIPGIGMYISSMKLTKERSYFELEIVNLAECKGGEEGGGGAGPPRSVGGPVIGLCSHRYPMDMVPGHGNDSVGLNASEGKLYKGRPRGKVLSGMGKTWQPGDRIGCGIQMESLSAGNGAFVPVFFTKNGKEVYRNFIPYPPGGLFPAFALLSPTEEVKLNMVMRWNSSEDDVAMSVDSEEKEEWHRLHDIRLNGQVLEYIGRGKSLADVGLAQAKTALCTRSHYFEIEIVDPGSNCYIAIGLARKDYPKDRHPGWNKGSIAFHADDGKVFMGSGTGDPFGPRCYKGDIMGCGVLFPRDYELRSDSEEEELLGGVELLPGGGAPPRQQFTELDRVWGEEADSGEDDEYCSPSVNALKQGDKVQVFFTRNGKMIGKKDVYLPKGGFYPTIGMMSSQEKVRVELRPLSG